MQMDLDFAQPFSLQFGEPLKQRPMILFAGIKVGVTKRRSVTITNGVADRAGLLTPVVEPRQLRGPIQRAALLVPSRFEMVRHHQDQVTRTRLRRQAPPELLRSPERVTHQPGE